MSLPILTLDERILSPRLGYVFHRRWLDPYESIVGMLWKFARLNALPGHVAVPQLCRVPVDPYEGVELTAVDVRAVARLLGVTQRSISAGLGPTRSDTSAWVRYCRKCVASGYHGALHQLGQFERCPAHATPIESACRHCSRTSAYRLDAQLLDAPFRCRHCRRHYSSSSTTNNRFRGFAAHERRAITRARLS